MLPPSYNVVKSLGEREAFSDKKILSAIKRSGASKKVALDILEKVKENFVPDMSTGELFKMIRSFLKKEEPQASIRFSLKYAIKALGPAGFLFEKYIYDVLEDCGYEVRLNPTIRGRCITYERDVLAKKDGVMYLGECKYRNRPGEKVDVNVCLKEYAILKDVERGGYFSSDRSLHDVRNLVITNTRFTNQAAKYANCVGMHLLGWRHPNNDGLERMIEEKGLYPITILPSFKRNNMDYFAQKEMMLAKDMLDIQDIAKFSEIAKIPEKQINALCQEARLLLEIK